MVLDTTILVYALGSGHPLREPCRDIVRAVGDGRLGATTTVEVLQKFTHVRARRHGRPDAAERASQYATLLAPLIAVDAEDLASGLHLFAERDRIGAFDAVLAAAALRREHITALVSADAGFGSVPALTHLDPADPDARDELGI